MADPASPPRLIRFGVFEVDLRSGELRKHGLKVKLQEQPFEILTMLLAHPGEVVTREELRKKLWPEDTFVDFDNSLNTDINKIREALGDSAHNPRFVETLPRRGYRFIYPVAPVHAQRSEIAAHRAALQKRLALAAGVIAPLVAALLALNVGGLRDRMLTAVGARRAVPLPKIESIAVLPLKNLSGDPEQEYFADGMTDALITELGKVSALRVISIQSVLRYKGTAKPVPEIARELNVDALVEGSVLRSGERVRINAQLVQAKPEKHVWSESFERNVRDILALQDDVARAFAGAVQAKLTPQEEARLARTYPVNPAALEGYLKGRYSAQKATREGYDRAIPSFQEAIRVDGNFAPPDAGLAWTYVALGHNALLPPQESFPKARTAAMKALEIDPTLAAAHGVLASVRLLYDWDWSGAEDECRQAKKLNPNDPSAYRCYAVYFLVRGRFDEAMTEIKRALELDPLSLDHRSHLGWVLYWARRYDEAIEQQRLVLDINPDLPFALLCLGLAHERKGNFEEAIGEIERVVALTEDKALLTFLAHAYAVAGKEHLARKVLAEMSDLGKSTYISPFAFANVYVGLGEKDEAMRWLGVGFKERDHDIAYLKCWPMLDPLRSDPRFQDLLRRMNLPP